jgi:hypothetical protein
MHAQVAQLVEHSTENAGVGCSIQPLGTNYLPLAIDIKRFFGLIHPTGYPNTPKIWASLTALC